MFIQRRSGGIRFAVLAAFLLAAGSAAAQPLVQIGSAREADAPDSEFHFAGGYEIGFVVLPVSIVAVAQTGSGIRSGEDSRQFPLRGYLTVRAGLLPLPGFRVYLGAGGGMSARTGGEDGLSASPSLIGLGGIATGRLHLEVQYQRDLTDVPVSRWVTAVGLSF